MYDTTTVFAESYIHRDVWLHHTKRVNDNSNENNNDNSKNNHSSNSNNDKQ